jgi:hypothetical protein
LGSSHCVIQAHSASPSIFKIHVSPSRHLVLAHRSSFMEKFHWVLGENKMYLENHSLVFHFRFLKLHFAHLLFPFQPKINHKNDIGQVKERYPLSNNTLTRQLKYSSLKRHLATRTLSSLLYTIYKYHTQWCHVLTLNRTHLDIF